jgi:hypothetical protein
VALFDKFGCFYDLTPLTDFFCIGTKKPPETKTKKIQKLLNLNKMSVRNYIAQAKEQAVQNYSGFTGNQSANGGYNRPTYKNMVGESFNTVVGDNMRLASGSGMNSAPQSQPYIITVSNSSATAVSNFDVLGAYSYLSGGSMPSTPAGTAAFSAGNLVVTGAGYSITISSAIANVNYQQFLYQSMNQPFSVGLTYLESVAGSSTQISQTFTLNTQDANGNQLLRTIVPTIDPYQQQSTIVAVKQLYSIDGFTKLTFSQILASSVFRIHFYPSTNINLAAGLQGSSVAQQYGNPNIVGVPTYIQG